MEKTQRWQIASGLVILAGVWLIIAPFVLGYQDQTTPTAANIFYGFVITAVALWRTFGGAGSSWLSWVLVVLGLGVLFAPFYLNYGWTESAFNQFRGGVRYGTFPLVSVQNAALWNDVITGTFLTVVAAASALIGRSRTP